MLRAPARVFLLTVLLAACGLAQSLSDVPAACNFHALQIQQDSTFVYGVNNQGAIVGTYNPSPSSQLGFLLKGGNVTNIAYPGAGFTSAYAVNDAGSVVGVYQIGLFDPQQGYRWSKGRFVTITYPHSLATYPTGINLSGEVVGTYQDSQALTHGFVRSASGYETIDYPGAQSTIVSQINDNGVMVGGYMDSSNVEHGFLYQDGTFTEVNHPDAINTTLTDVNEKMEVSGTYYNADYTEYHGFVWSNGHFRTLSDPADPNHTAINGINNLGVLVGNRDNSGTGFWATGCVP